MKYLCPLGLSILLVSPAAGADWPQFLGPTRDGVSPETGLVDSWPRTGPPVVWRRDVGDGYAGPVVAGGRLVLFHRDGDRELVECLDAATGKTLWKHAEATSYSDPLGKGDGPRSTPAVADGHVFSLSPGGRLLCLRLADGTKLWQRMLLEDYEVPPSYFGVGTSPLVEGGRVLVNVGAKDAGVVALDAGTGREAWRATGQGASYSSPVAATIDGVRHVFFFTREGLVSVDPATGAVRFAKRWRSRMDASVNAASPVVFDGHVFLSACYGTGAVLLKVRKDGVDAVWKNDESLSCHFGTPVYHDGHLYGFDGRQEEGARLRCVEARTGKVCWTEAGYGCGSMILAEGRLIVVGEGGELALVAADPGRYRELARAPLLDRPCRAQPALSGGRLYARDNRQLVCWDLRKK
jgi:outer membrane protein assembly factor BamB